MRHRVKKIKVRSGKDANSMLVRKLVLNFLKKGSIRTTLKKAKLVKPVVERLVDKAKKNNEASRNVILRKLGHKEFIETLLKEIGPRFGTRIGGYVRIVKDQQRGSDGSEMAIVKWIDVS